MTSNSETHISTEPLLADPFGAEDDCATLKKPNNAAAEEPGSTSLSTRRTYLRHWSAVMMTLLIFTLASVQKKVAPDPFKHMKYGRVRYYTEDTDEGRIYHREIAAPCMYGVLTFAVAPAAKNLPYTFDVYNDEFSYKDAICPIKPTRKIHKSSPLPFLNPGDPTMVKAKFTYLTRISTKVVHPVNAKQVSDDLMAEYAGEYVVVAAGRFYDANVYRQLIDIVHNFTMTTTSSTTTGLADERFLTLAEPL